MGTVYKETYTKPLPAGAEVFTKSGERWARWTDRHGRKRAAKMTTGCRTKNAAETLLTELHTRADKVRAGAWMAAEDSVLDYQSTPVENHAAAYVEHLRAKRGKGGRRSVNLQHIANVEYRLDKINRDCRFDKLRDLNRSAAERTNACTNACTNRRQFAYIGDKHCQCG